MVGAHLLVSRPAGGVLNHLFQEFHQMLWSDLVASLPSWVLEPALLPAWVNLLFQREDPAGQPVGSHADSSQVVLF
jgi:hypothetical protein